MMQHYFQNELSKTWSIFSDPEFIDFRQVLDSEMKTLARESYVREKKRKNYIVI